MNNLSLHARVSHRYISAWENAESSTDKFLAGERLVSRIYALNDEVYRLNDKIETLKARRFGWAILVVLFFGLGVMI